MLHWFLLDLAFFINIIIHLILCFAFCWAAVGLLPSLDVVGCRPLGTGSFTMLLNKHIKFFFIYKTELLLHDPLLFRSVFLIVPINI